MLRTWNEDRQAITRRSIAHWGAEPRNGGHLHTACDIESSAGNMASFGWTLTHNRGCQSINREKSRAAIMCSGSIPGQQQFTLDLSRPFVPSTAALHIETEREQTGVMEQDRAPDVFVHRDEVARLRSTAAAIPQAERHRTRSFVP